MDKEDELSSCVDLTSKQIVMHEGSVERYAAGLAGVADFVREANSVSRGNRTQWR